jgi:hypothetical protein
MWEISACPNCEGSGYDFRCDCEAPCECFGEDGHDRICPVCDGFGKVPSPVRGFDAWIAKLAGVRLFRRRRDCVAAIEDDLSWATT